MATHAKASEKNVWSFGCVDCHIEKKKPNLEHDYGFALHKNVSDTQ